MKPAILMLAITFAFLSCGRLVKLAENERKIQKIYNVELSADQIYDTSLEWLTTKFSSRDEYIDYRDKNKKKIMGRGIGKYSEYFNFLVDRQFGYLIIIEAKDGKFRVTFDNFTVYYDERSAAPRPAVYKFELDSIRSRLEPMMEELFSRMKLIEKHNNHIKTDIDW
jgi:hypothetical protein